MRTRQRWTTVLLVGGLLSTAACGGDSESASTAGPATTEVTATSETAVVTTDAATTTTEADAVAADVELAIAGDAQVSTGGGAAAPAADGQELSVGDVVTTGEAPATLLYTDGSIVRLDAASEFEISADTRGALHAGRAWNRVAPQTEADGFVIETEAVTVTAKGTAFVLDCTTDATMCGLTVLEGAVELSDGSTTGEITAPATTNVLEGLTGVSLPINWDMAFGDPFVLESANADATLNADFVTADVIGEQLGASFASVEGSYLAIRTVVDCQPDPAICTGSRAVGDVAERTYTFSLDCSGGYPCQGTAITEFSQNGQAATEEVPVSFDGTTLTWARDAMEPSCTDDAGQELGSTHNVITWTLTPTEAEFIDGKYVMSGGLGTATASNERIDISTCTGDPRSYTQISEIQILGRA